MDESFVIYSTTDGSVRAQSTGPAGAWRHQQPPEGFAILVVPHAALLNPEMTFDIEPVRASLVTRVDAEAGATRALFITSTPGQAETYIYKAREARAYAAGADPAGFPFLAAEAEATDTTIAALAAIVIAQEDAWMLTGAKIEAARQKAHKQLADASDLADLAGAAQVDWAAVVA